MVWHEFSQVGFGCRGENRLRKAGVQGGVVQVTGDSKCVSGLYPGTFGIQD